jgi:hypothetical protein
MRVLSALATAAQEQFLEGRPFSIEGLGTFALSIHGSFPGPDALWDSAVNKVGVRFRADKSLADAAVKAPLNRLHGISHGPIIDSVVDQNSNTVNQKVSSGHIVRLSGKSIKIAGEGSGITFTAAGGQSYAVPASDLSHNGPTEVSFICPAIPNDTVCHLTLSTRSLANKSIGELRTFLFPHELTAIAG